MRAMATGLKLARRIPADGDAFFILGMMNPSPGPISRAARKSRTGGAASRRRSSSAAGSSSRRRRISSPLGCDDAIENAAHGLIVYKGVSCISSSPPVLRGRGGKNHSTGSVALNPDADAWQNIWAAVFSYAGIVTGGGLVASALYYFKPVRRWFPPPQDRFGHWTGGEISLIYCLAILLAPSAILSMLEHAGFYQQIYGRNPHKLEAEMWAMSLSFPLSLLLIFIPLRVMSQTRPSDLGLRRENWPGNYLLGYFGFAAITPGVLFLQWLLSLGVETKQHTLLDLRTETNWINWLLAFFVVCVSAPVLEELMVRGLLLGWLRRTSLAGFAIVLALVGFMSFYNSCKFVAVKAGENEGTLPQIETIFWGRVVFTALMLVMSAVYLWQFQRNNLFQTEAEFLPAIPQQEATQAWVEAFGRWQARDLEQQRCKGGSWRCSSRPSSSPWAHPSWPDPVPLFILALLLGWLAQRTQNLLPGMVLHAFFNGVSFLALYLSAHNVPVQRSQDPANAKRGHRRYGPTSLG